MTDITWTDKAIGGGSGTGEVSDDDMNEIKTAVNSKSDKQPSRLELTTDTSITATQLLDNEFITNQGASGEIDITLPAVSYSIARNIVVEETQVIEVNPPSGEAFMFNGTLLDANDVIDSPAIVGCAAVVVRQKNASGTWLYNLISVLGTWVDSGASD